MAEMLDCLLQVSHQHRGMIERVHEPIRAAGRSSTLGGENRALDVDVDGTVQVAGIHLSEWTHRGNAGVVDQDVEPPETLAYGREQTVELLRIPHVCLERHPIDAECPDCID